MGDVIVTADKNTPTATDNQILVVRPYNGTPTPTSRQPVGTYYSFKNKWYDFFSGIYDRIAAAFVPKTRTITINGTTQDLSENRTYTVTAAAANLADVLAEGNDGDGIAIENIADPTNAQDAATKAYVDSNVVSPAGSTTEVQYNNTGAFGADSTFTFNSATKELTIQAGILSGGTASQLVQLDGSKKFTTSNTLPNGTTATTQTIGDDSTKVATTEYVSRYFNPTYMRRVSTDFTGFGTALSASTDVGTDWRATIANSGSTARDTASYSNATGVLNFLTNASSNARVFFSSFGWYLGVKQTMHMSILKIPVLASAAQNFYTVIGLVNTTSFAAITDCVMVYCINGTNSGNWVIQTMQASTPTTFNTSITPVADTFTTIEITVNAAGNEVRVYFNGVEPSGIGYPITTNIPAASANQLFGSAAIEKTAGGTSRSIGVDFLETQQF